MARFSLPIEQLVNSDASGVADSWTLDFYITGTTTRKDTFSDSALTTANDNPVVADSAGRFGDIFLESGTYKVVLSDSTGTEIWTADPVDGAPGASGAVVSKTASYTVTVSDATKTILVDATTGDLTITLLAAATAGDGFEVTVKKTDSTANSVTIDGNGAETIDGGATLVLTRQYQTAILRTDGSAWHLRNNPPLVQADTDVASAAALAVDIDGTFFDVTGTTTITSINSKGLGAFIVLQFDDALTLTHHATNLILPGGANITTAAGDIAVFWEYGSGAWRCVSYQQADGEPVVLPSASDSAAGIIQVATQAEQETATSTTKAVTPGRQHFHPGNAKAWASVSYDGAGNPTLDQSYGVSSITDTAVGRLTINLITFSTTTYAPVPFLLEAADNVAVVVASRTTTAVELQHRDGASGLTDPGSGSMGCAIFGDI